MARGWHLSFEQHFDRFMAKVLIDNSSIDSCWLWQGFIGKGGYGRYKWNDRKNWIAPRLMYQLVLGDVDPKLKVCHTCDNTKCVRPSHLFQATQAKNIKDMINKGRGNLKTQFGTINVNAKLSPDKIRQIRILRSKGDTIVHLGEMFGVSHSNISNICLGKTWKHVKWEEEPKIA